MRTASAEAASSYKTFGDEAQSQHLYYDNEVFGLRRPQKTHMHSKKTAPAESGVARRRSRALGFVPTLGKFHPGLE
jgi:hypothetical protein